MFKKLIGIVTVFGYLLQACGAPDPNANGSNGSTAADSVASKGFAEPAKAATPNLNRYSTEELARGMFFGDGPVAEAIPTVRNNFLLTDKVKDPQALAQQREAIGFIVQKTKEANPAAFESFRQDVLSGDHVRISAAMGSMSKSVLQTISQNKVGGTTASGSSDKGLCLVAALVVVVAVWETVAAGVHVVAGVNIELVIVIDQWLGISSPVSPDCTGDCKSSDGAEGSGQQGLMVENMVADIATAAVPVWLWQPDLSVKRPRDLQTSANNVDLLLADLDGDGLKDRVYWDFGTNEVTVFKSWDNTVSTFTAPALVVPWVEPLLYEPVIGDFDGNGYEDILWTSRDYLSLIGVTFPPKGVHKTGYTLWMFGPQGYQSYNYEHDFGYYPIAGDFDNNGVSDIYFFSQTLPDDVWWSDGNNFYPGTAPDGQGRYVPIAGNFFYTAGDANRRWDPTDIMFVPTDIGQYWGNNPESVVYFRVWPGLGVDSFSIPVPAASYSSAARPSIGDFDNNGLDDVLWQVWNQQGNPVADTIWVAEDPWCCFAFSPNEGPVGRNFPKTGNVNHNGPMTFFWPHSAARTL